MKNKILIKITLLFSLFSTFSVFGQLEVAITMDDVPNKTFFISSDKYSTLKTLDSLNIPICIFINEGKIFKEDSITKKKLLTDWISRRYITLGNHSYSHYRYSEVGFDVFSEDIKKGEIVTLELAKKNNKELKYFRFPYNDLGIDSLQHKKISNFLEINNYQITPFTIESMDWMYNYVYEYYLSKNEVNMANKIGLEYVNKTIEYFNYIENITQNNYGRKIRQVYMCHDNILNSRYLPRIVVELKHKKYKFISLKKALKDKVYNQEDKYYKKWGISWIYRWMNDQNERSNVLKNEPNTEEIENLYNSILKENK